jgi:hypothetical protein
MLLFLALARNPQRIQVVVVVPMPRSIAIGMVGELLVVRLGLGIAEVEEGQTSVVGLLSEVAEPVAGAEFHFWKPRIHMGQPLSLGSANNAFDSVHKSPTDSCITQRLSTQGSIHE